LGKKIPARKAIRLNSIHSDAGGIYPLQAVKTYSEVELTAIWAFN
jgi:hypothetical protein